MNNKLKVSKIILLISGTGFYAYAIGNSFEANYHTDKFLIGLPGYLLIAVLLVMTITFGTKAIKQPQNKNANDLLLALCVIPNLLFGIMIFRSILDYRSAFLPALVASITSLAVFINYIVFYIIEKKRSGNI